MCGIIQPSKKTERKILYMRDPKRIRAFCSRLATAWESRVPDWRFGQMICNIFGEMSLECDPFFPEEDKMIEYIENYLKVYGRKS